MKPEEGRATYSPDQFARLFSVEARHFWFKSRNRCIAAALRTLPDLNAIRNVLEVGCGTGIVLEELQRLLPQARLVGLDLFQEGLEFARRRFDGTLIQADVLQYRPEQPFDLVGAFDVIEHLDDDETLLRHLSERLRPGGHVVLTVPAHGGLWSYFDEVAHHRRRYEVAELKAKLVSAGFVNVYVTQFMMALFPIMWLKRHFIGDRAKGLSQASREEQQAAAESDLRINPLTNWLLTMLTRPDAFLISRRLPVPVGTSLLALASRSNCLLQGAKTLSE